MTDFYATPEKRLNWQGLLLGLAALFQVALVFNFYAVDWTKRVWRLRALPAEDRSAVFFLGHRAAAYVDFIESVTPEDASLVIPPGAEWLSSQSVLLFYLLPRSAIACQCVQGADADSLPESCIQCLRSPESYIPAIGDFPPAEAVDDIKDFIPYDQDTGWFHGIYVPKGSTSAASIPAPDAIYSPLRALAIDVLILLGFLALGAGLAIGILNQFSWSAFLSLGIPLGAGVWTWFVFLTSWAGIPLSLTSIWITFAVIFTSTILISWVLLGRKNRVTAPSIREKILDFRKSVDPVGGIAALGVVGLLLLSVVLSVGRAYSTFDAMTIWSLKGYGIAYDRTIFAFNRLGGHGLAYPLNIPLAVSFFRLADGDVLPGSKMLMPLFTGSLLVGCYRYWRRWGVNANIAFPAMLLLLSVPLVFTHTTTGFVNLVFTAYLVMAVFWSIEGLFEDRPRALVMGGLLFALAAWSRPEGTGFSLVMIVTLLASRWIADRKRFPPVGWLLPFIVIAGSWSLIGTRHIVGDEIGQVIQGFLQDVVNGRANWNNIRFIFVYEIAEIRKIQVWGVLFFVCSFLLLLGLRKIHRWTDPRQIALIAATLVAVAVPVGMMIVGSFSKTPFIVWLSVSMNRAMFPAVFLGTVLSVIVGSSAGSRRLPDRDRGGSTVPPS